MSVQYDKQSVDFYRSFVEVKEAAPLVMVLPKEVSHTLSEMLARQGSWMVYSFALSIKARGIREARHALAKYYGRHGVTCLKVITKKGVGLVAFHKERDFLSRLERGAFPVLPTDVIVYSGRYHCAYDGSSYFHLNRARPPFDSVTRGYTECLTFLDGSELFM